MAEENVSATLNETVIDGQSGRRHTTNRVGA
jgi:hypothetical protein